MTQSNAPLPVNEAAIGIIMLDTAFPRIPGDIGNPSTFPFSVRYEVVEGASPHRVVHDADPRLIEPFRQAARSLEKQGVKAIATSCGFLAMFQRALADAVDIPVFSSSLMQIHAAHRALNGRKKVGVLTADAVALTERHFKGVGAGGIPVVVMGMEEAEEFTDVFIRGRPSFDREKIKKEMVRAAEKMAEFHPEIGALVLECTNMPPYAKAVQEVLGIPVFDVVTMIFQVHAALKPRVFPGD